METIKTIVYAVLIALVVRTIAYEPFNIPSGSMVPTLLVGDYLFVSKYSYGYSRFSLPSWPIDLPQLFSPGGLLAVPFLSHPPQRGDVVVFKVPTDNSTDFIKRIIGLPGDQIQVRQDRLYLKPAGSSDFVAVPQEPAPACRNEESDIPLAAETGAIETLPRGPGQAPVRHCIIMAKDQNLPIDNTPVYQVPPGHYFMMGDNRDNSEDSRVAFQYRDPSEAKDCYGPGSAHALCYVPAENLVGRARIIFFSTDGEAQWWQVWDWPFTIRYGRLFHGIH